jgi:hypothetical protein
VGYFKQSSETITLQGQLAEVTKKYAEAVTEPTMGSAEYNNLKEQARATGSASVYDVLSVQRSDLAVLVVGQPMTSPEVAQRAEQANRQANAALREAAGKAGLPLAAGSSLIETLGRWPAVVNQLFEQQERLKRDAAANDLKMKAAESAHQLALAEKDRAIADARAEVAKANQQLAAYQDQRAKALGSVQATAAQAAQDQAQQLAAEEVAAAQKDRENADLSKEVVKLKLALRKTKANPLPGDSVVRVPDGQIKIVAGNECFINLGKGDQLPVGMTFEVYDAVKGIPPLASQADPQPTGKGSIEVVSVGPDHTAECRIIHVVSGEMIGPGDLIANLVYHPNIKLNFLVLGDFDLGSGTHGNDAKVIRRLVEQWGGQVQPIADAGDPAKSVSPDLDFLVVGKEPQMPNLSAEEQARPEGVKTMDDSSKKLGAYRAVLAQAAEYGIPVMNQNRFLYYSGPALK